MERLNRLGKLNRNYASEEIATIGHPLSQCQAESSNADVCMEIEEEEEEGYVKVNAPGSDQSSDTAVDDARPYQAASPAMILHASSLGAHEISRITRSLGDK
jgi:hypothetical protein